MAGFVAAMGSCEIMCDLSLKATNRAICIAGIVKLVRFVTVLFLATGTNMPVPVSVRLPLRAKLMGNMAQFRLHNVATGST